VVRVIDAPVANVPVELEDGTVEVGTQPGRWRVFEENPDKPGEFDLIEEGLHGFDGIPLVTLYFDRVGFMEGRPPFLDVAHLNLAHYRSTARQRQYLDVVRLAFLWGSGLSREELEQGITISPSRLAGSTKSGASMEWVEHTGAAASVGVEDLRDLEDKMLRLSLEPMQQRGGGNPTATGRAIEASKTQTDIEAWVRLVEAGIEMAYAMAAEWRSVELPEEFACDIWSDFALAMSKSEDIEQLVKMHVAGILSRETILQEIKRRGLLSDRVDVDEELQRVIDEAMAAQEAFDVDGDVGNDDPNPQGRPREPVAAGG
ncbi:MAG: DUF4055 domain-containing protein, partial [Mycobacterium sp.]